MSKPRYRINAVPEKSDFQVVNNKHYWEWMNDVTLIGRTDKPDNYGLELVDNTRYYTTKLK